MYIYPSSLLSRKDFIHFKNGADGDQFTTNHSSTAFSLNCTRQIMGFIIIIDLSS